MNGEERRHEILSMLRANTKPISATAMAEKFGISRQAIVQDIALLRAAGAKITSLSRGYVLDKSDFAHRVFKVRHTDLEVGEELGLIVDLGGVVDNVFVFHKIYGTLSAPLNIISRDDVNEFVASISAGKSSLLKNVTSGYHYHKVSADTTETLDAIEKALTERGFIAPLREYEPNEMSEK